MNKSLYAVGAFTLSLAISGVPTLALARSDSGEVRTGSSAELQAQTQEIRVQSNVSVSREEEMESSEGEKKQEVKEQEGNRHATSSNERAGDRGTVNDQDVDENQGEIHLELEDDADVAFSLGDLKKKIEKRKHELDDEEASTTIKSREIVKNANEVRLAVHALLASKLLLGGIGQEVSKIAKEMNNSVATTTNAEARIQARGFFARLFFGGDIAAADVIAQAVARNQQHIDDLTKLLGEANVSADIQVTLRAQIAAIQDAQVHLQDLAQKEQEAWGVFSWRF